jgi:hypothetical protein
MDYGRIDDGKACRKAGCLRIILLNQNFMLLTPVLKAVKRRLMVMFRDKAKTK